MPRYFIHENGCDSGWFQCLPSDDPVEWFAARISRTEARRAEVDGRPAPRPVTAEQIFVYRRADGTLTGLMVYEAGGHRWHANRERTLAEEAGSRGGVKLRAVGFTGR